MPTLSIEAHHRLFEPRRLSESLGPESGNAFAKRLWFRASDLRCHLFLGPLGVTASHSAMSPNPSIVTRLLLELPRRQWDAADRRGEDS